MNTRSDDSPQPVVAGTVPDHPSGADAVDRAVRWLVAGVLAYLALAWTAVLAIDAANVFGLRDALVDSPVDPPALWWHLFMNRTPTEWVQWGVLGAFALVSARLSAQLGQAGAPVAARFWTGLSVLGVLMLIEDAGDPRHRIAQYAMWVSEDGFTRFTAELLFFFFLGAVAGYALLLYGSVLRRSRRAFTTMWAGVVTYATVGMMSASRTFLDWYRLTGDWIREQLLGGRMLSLDTAQDAHEDHDSTGYHFMDSFIEESIELAAATLLLVAALRYLSHWRRDPSIAEVHDGLWAREHLWSRRPKHPGDDA